MGGCYSIDLSISEESESLDKILEGNLSLLRGIALRTLEEKSIGAALKLYKVLDFTSTHYKDLQRTRQKTVSKGHHINTVDYFSLEKAMGKEKALAYQTRKSLSKMYKTIHKEWILPSFDTVESRINDAEVDLYFKLDLLKNALNDMKEKNDSIEAAVFKVNRGKPLTDEEEEFVKEICSHTTYMFNKTENKVCYPQPPVEKQTQKKPSPERIRKMKTVIELNLPKRSTKRGNTMPVQGRFQTKIFQTEVDEVEIKV